MASQTAIRHIFFISCLMLILSILICIRPSGNGHSTCKKCVYSPVTLTLYYLNESFTTINLKEIKKRNGSEIMLTTGLNNKCILDGKTEILICKNQLCSVMSGRNGFYSEMTFCFENSFPIKSLFPVINILLSTIAFICCSTEFSKFPAFTHSWKIVFQYRFRNIQKTLCYPFSIGKYFNDIDKGVSMQKQKLMNYEWARLSSFKSFPNSSRVSSIRLAQSGFYYTEKGTEAVCFCCGLKNELWDTNETVHAIHKRLSPNCKFVKGEETNNVAIHEGNNTNAASDSFTHEKRYPTEGATGGPEDVQTENEGNYRNEINSHSELGHSLNNNVDVRGLRNSSNSSTPQECSIHTARTHKHSRHFASDENRVPAANRFPGIINEQPKHPEYVTKVARLISFTGWPSAVSVQPEALSTAGFFYAGIKDCVRCFFCGSGMKNWEHEDNPWIEHARWSPNCAYVKHCKGDNFVAMCQGANIQISITAGVEGSEGLNSQETIIAEDSFIEDLNSSAATKAIDMGYTQTQVEDAIKKARHIHGKTELKAHILLEFLLENDLDSTISSSPHSNQDQNLSNGEDKPIPKSHAEIKTNEQRALREENQQLKEQMMCKICMDKDANIVFLPCGHMVSCIECAPALRKCAICRKIIQGTVRTYPA